MNLRGDSLGVTVEMRRRGLPSGQLGGKGDVSIVHGDWI
jgi:hypothetical protein